MPYPQVLLPVCVQIANVLRWNTMHALRISKPSSEVNMANDTQDAGIPKPDPALRRLERLVGTWHMKGQTVGSSQQNISGTTTFKWLNGGSGESFFLQQDMDMDYGGTPIKSHELIGYNPTTKAFSSNVYSNMAPDPWPYEWDIRDDSLTISIEHGPMNATFTGKFAPDGDSFSGGWRPNPGADQTINAPYDISASRIT
jgi:hypothetical protein